jgi:hypothetical protein
MGNEESPEAAPANSAALTSPESVRIYRLHSPLQAVWFSSLLLRMGTAVVLIALACAAAGLLAPAWWPAACAGLVLLIGVTAGLWLWPTRVRVGHDGLTLSWIGADRFIAYSDIDLVSPWQTDELRTATDRSGLSRQRAVGLMVKLKSGREVIFVTTVRYGRIHRVRGNDMLRDGLERAIDRSMHARR